MLYDPPLKEATLLKRYKRFLADVRLTDGSEITVHCPNPGAMLGLNQSGSRVWLHDSNNPKRKLRYTLELMRVGSTMVGINTNRANNLALEAMRSGLVPQVGTMAQITPEQKYGNNSRVDFLITENTKPSLFVEVKNVHLQRQDTQSGNAGLHEFPDSVTERGLKHLRELSRQVQQGNKALMLFLVQRDDGDKFTIARDLDPAYAAGFDEAIKTGMEAIAIKCKVSVQGITPIGKIQIV